MTRLLAIFLLCFSALGASPTLYVSKDGDNSDGLSWATAKNELDQIVWSHNAGDILQIDGGVTGMVYSTVMTPNSRGTAGNPVIIKRSTEVGHDGPVYFTPTASGYAILLKCVNNLHDIRIDGGATNLCFLDGSGYAGGQHGVETFLSGSTALYNIEWCNMTVRYWSNGGGMNIRGYSNGWYIHHLNVTENGGNSTSQHGLAFDAANCFGTWHGSTVSNCYFGNEYGVNDCIETPSAVWVQKCVIDLGDNTSGSSADGIFLTNTRDVDIDSNIFKFGSRTNQGIYCATTAANTSSNIWIRNNIFYAAAPTKDHFGVYIHARNAAGLIQYVLAANNTFYNIGNAFYCRCEAVASYGAGCAVENNLIHIGLNTAGFLCLDVSDTGATNITYNHNYYDSNSGLTGGQIINWLGTPKTLAQAQALGYVELQGYYGNPLFVNVASLPDGLYFNYASPKPPRYAGINLSSYFTTDRNGTTRPGVNPWTIGAVECAADLFPLRGHLIPKP